MSESPHTFEPTTAPWDETAGMSAPTPGAGIAPVSLIPVVIGQIERELAIDSAIRWTGLAVAIIAGLAITLSMPHLSWILMVLIMVSVFGMSIPSARIWPQIAHLGALIDADPARAETLLRQTLRRRPLHRHLRLLLFHRLAQLRFRQSRFAEAAQMCREILAQRLGSAHRVRGNLLLMLTSAALATRDLATAWWGLSELYRTRLNLPEALQRLLLETRYATLAGHSDHVLANLYSKLDLAELMPPFQCGAMHVALATAARQSGRDSLANWLDQRATLLCSPEQLTMLRTGT